MMLSGEQILEYDAEEALNIRYVRLTFVITFPGDCTLPAHKASALRGGMGQRLLEQNCVRDRGCDRCDFEEDCMVRRIMYAKNRLPVRYGGKGESNGYIIECENTKTQFHQGERLRFRVTLFGRFGADPILRALMRRIYTMDCFEGIDLPLMSWEECMPEEVYEESRLCSVTRYSSAHESRITLTGLKGEIRLTKVPEALLLCLTAGEVLHIGSNTSFGFGRYVLERS